MRGRRHVLTVLLSHPTYVRNFAKRYKLSPEETANHPCVELHLSCVRQVVRRVRTRTE